VQTLEEIASQIHSCTLCPLFKSKGITSVPGDGNPMAKILLIGEAPGASESQSGIPFVGRSGQLLNNLLEKAGIQRKDVFIANSVRCRPPENRKPSNDEIQKCFPFLKAQIDIIKPNVIILVGAVALNIFFPNYKITKSIGLSLTHRDFGQTFVPIFHPSYLLRNFHDKTLQEKTIANLISAKNLI